MLMAEEFEEQERTVRAIIWLTQSLLKTFYLVFIIGF